MSKSTVAVTIDFTISNSSSKIGLEKVDVVMVITPSSSDNVPSVPEDVRQAAQLLVDMAKAQKADNDQYPQLVKALSVLYSAGKLNTLLPALPLVLKLKGKPYSLHRHFVMEPMFS